MSDDNIENEEGYSKTIYCDGIELASQDGELTDKERKLIRDLAIKEQKRREAKFSYKFRKACISILDDALDSFTAGAKKIIGTMVTLATVAAGAYFTGVFEPKVPVIQEPTKKQQTQNYSLD